MSTAALTGVLIAGCSSSNKDVSPQTEAATTPRLELPADPPAKEAVDALKQIFTASGIDPDIELTQTSTLGISSCPLGQTSALTASPPAPIAGLEAKTSFTLERPADPEPGIRCSFSNDLPADVANSIPATRTSSFLEYQVTYVPGAKLNSYLSFIGGQGYEQVKNAAVGGAVYTNCADPTAASSGGATSFVDCGAIWLNSVVVVGMRFTGPQDKPVDVPTWLVSMIVPILDSLAKTAPASVVAGTVTSTP